MNEDNKRLLRIVPKLSPEQEEAEEHYQRIRDAKEATNRHLTNWQEKDKLAKALASEAAIERYEESKQKGSPTKYLSYNVAHKCLEYVLDNIVTDETKCKGIIYSIATQEGYTIDKIDKAYNLGCQDTKEYRKSLLDSFKTQLDSLTRHTPLTKTQLNHKQANTLPKLIKAIIRAIKWREDRKAIKEDRKKLKELEIENQLLRLELDESKENQHKANLKRIAYDMSIAGFTQNEIANKLDTSERTIRRWLKTD